jgi:predicted dehydrogenase
MINIGLIGCGQIADAHLQQIARIPYANVVAVCDLEPLLARQAAERFGVPQQFTDVDRMLSECQLDVVHVTTPVHTHGPIAKQVLAAGCHVYVEKPFSIDGPEARDVIRTAQNANRMVCIGHDQLWDPVWLEAQEIIASGQIGEVQHIDSWLGYPINGPFGKQVTANPNHWVRRLPGGLFQNTISHPLYRITELLPDEEPEVWATWFEKLPEIPFPTELRVHLKGASVTGSCVFTSTTKPCHRLVRIHGTEAGFEVDLNTQLIRFDRTDKFPGALGKIESAWRQRREGARNFRKSLKRFLKGGFHYFDGMKELFDRFYQAILNNTEPPIPATEILRFTDIMDRIFESASGASRTTKQTNQTAQAENQPERFLDSHQPQQQPINELV